MKSTRIPGTAWLALAAGLVMAIATGCGAPPAAVDGGKRLDTLNIVTGTQTREPIDHQVAMRRLMGEVNAVRMNTNNIKCKLTGYYVSLEDGKEGSTLFDFYFEKPNKTALVVVNDSKGATTGTKLVWMGGSQMAVKTKLLGFWLKTSIDIHHEYAKDQRGYYIDETGINPMLNTLTDNRNRLTFQGTGTLDGLPIVRIGVVSPRSLEGVAREVFVVDTRRKIPLVREMYDRGGKMVFRIKLDQVALNSRLPSDTFKVQ